MNTTHKIRKFYLICCPDDRMVIARERRGPYSGGWWNEEVWELQEISEDWSPIGAAAYMYRSREPLNGWSVEYGVSTAVENEAIRHAYQYLAEELG